MFHFLYSAYILLLPYVTGINVLYNTFHSGTRVNFDAIAFTNGWNVTHIRPASGYKISRSLAHDVWQNHYMPLIQSQSPSFTHIVACDTIPAAGYPILLHAAEIPHIMIILEITNYYSYMNEDNEEYINDMKTLVHQPNVRIICVDKFCIYSNSDIFNYSISQIHYYPLHGMVSTHKYPFVDVGYSSSALDLYTPDVYYDTPPTSEPAIDTSVSSGDTQFINEAASPPENAPGPNQPQAGKNAVFISDRRGSCPLPSVYDSFYSLPIVDVLGHAAYGGPLAIKSYSGVVYLPYHYSTMSLQEHLSLGLVVFVQSKRLTRLCYTPLTNHSMIDIIANIDIMDVYSGPLVSLLEYYDSVEELLNKIALLQSLSRDVAHYETEDKSASAENNSHNLSSSISQDNDLPKKFYRPIDELKANRMKYMDDYNRGVMHYWKQLFDHVRPT